MKSKLKNRLTKNKLNKKTQRGGIRYAILGRKFVLATKKQFSGLLTKDIVIEDYSTNLRENTELVSSVNSLIETIKDDEAKKAYFDKSIDRLIKKIHNYRTYIAEKKANARDQIRAHKINVPTELTALFNKLGTKLDNVISNISLIEGWGLSLMKPTSSTIPSNSTELDNNSINNDITKEIEESIEDLDKSFKQLKEWNIKDDSIKYFKSAYDPTNISHVIEEIKKKTEPKIFDIYKQIATNISTNIMNNNLFTYTSEEIRSFHTNEKQKYTDKFYVEFKKFYYLLMSSFPTYFIIDRTFKELNSILEQLCNFNQKLFIYILKLLGISNPLLNNQDIFNSIINLQIYEHLLEKLIKKYKTSSVKLSVLSWYKKNIYSIFELILRSFDAINIQSDNYINSTLYKDSFTINFYNFILNINNIPLDKKKDRIESILIANYISDSANITTKPIKSLFGEFFLHLERILIIFPNIIDFLSNIDKISNISNISTNVQKYQTIVNISELLYTELLSKQFLDLDNITSINTNIEYIISGIKSLFIDCDQKMTILNTLAQEERVPTIRSHSLRKGTSSPPKHHPMLGSPPMPLPTNSSSTKLQPIPAPRKYKYDTSDGKKTQRRAFNDLPLKYKSNNNIRKVEAYLSNYFTDDNNKVIVQNGETLYTPDYRDITSLLAKLKKQKMIAQGQQAVEKAAAIFADNSLTSSASSIKPLSPPRQAVRARTVRRPSLSSGKSTLTRRNAYARPKGSSSTPHPRPLAVVPGSAVQGSANTFNESSLSQENDNNNTGSHSSTNNQGVIQFTSRLSLPGTNQRSISV